MKAQHAERAPFDDDREIIVGNPTGETYTFRASDFDRDKLVLEAFRDLVEQQDRERQRAIQSKASRETASRYGEVFTNFGRLGATVRDRSLLFNRRLSRIPDADRDAGVEIVRRGRPERFAEFIAWFCHLALRPQDYVANGMLTEEGRSRVASAVFHAKRWYLAERVGHGAIPVRSVTDTWFLTWLTLSYAELGAILTAASELQDVPEARSDEHLRAALARARQRRPLDKPERIVELRRDGSDDIPRESPAEVESRLAKVARLRWRQLQKLGAANARDLSLFDDPQS